MSENPLIDLFVPTVSNHFMRLQIALCCAFYQTYEPKRIVLWVEDNHLQLESMIEKYWYTPEDSRIPSEYGPKASVEYCKKGVLVRHLGAYTGHAGNARQWIFEWKGKSEYVKMFDSDDVLMPDCLKVMTRYLKDGIDGVLCPLLMIHENRLGSVMTNCDFKKGTVGSGSMLLSRIFMDKVMAMGFDWSKYRDHDKEFYLFLSDKLDQFSFVKTSETALYLYLKNWW
jgi:hypothetical protein